MIHHLAFRTGLITVFAFSYQVSGKDYSGEFSLVLYSYDFGESIRKMVVGRQLRDTIIRFLRNNGSFQTA
jgi:hypothetical protein